jgi:chromosome segregation ATPase
MDHHENAGDGEMRQTAYTTARIAEHKAFENALRASQADAEMAASLLSKIKVAHHHTREYLNAAYTAIHRANELEVSVARLTDENRVLRRHYDQFQRIREQYDSLSEAFKKRETKLTETADALRQSASAAKLENIDLGAKLNAALVEQQEIMNTLASTNLQMEGVSRENEMLREKQVNLLADNDQAARRRAEAERKVEELSAAHSRDKTANAELNAKLAMAEAERQRLQKQLDAVTVALTETKETLSVLEVEATEQAKRHDASIMALRAERDSLMSRLSTRVEKIGDADPTEEITSIAQVRRRAKNAA